MKTSARPEEGDRADRRDLLYAEEHLAIGRIGPVSYTHLDVYKRQLPYFAFVARELPALCRRFFPILSTRREDTFAGGVSMGGYGALKCALRAPETFSRAISLSGALDAADVAQNGGDLAPRAFWEDVFGPAEVVPGSENDLFSAAAEMQDSPLRPKVYMWCGTEDFLYAMNTRMRDHLRALGYDLTLSLIHILDVSGNWIYQLDTASE